MQGVLVFASSAARAAAITSPQEGQYSYLKDTNSTEYYDGAAWIAAPIGDITGVTAGTGISGGGTSGTVTITNSMATEITAAGDIIVGTGSGTFDNLPIGTTNQVLTADTTVSPYKVKWATAAAGGGTEYAAGKNAVINSNFSVWQRGTTGFVPNGTGVYTADRWQANRGTTGSTVSRQVTGDTTNLPNIQYAARVQRDSGTTATNSIFFGQSFETVNSIPFAGKTVTLSFYARAGANYSPTSSALGVNVASGSGTDQNLLTAGYTGSTNVVNTSATLTTTWQRFSYSGTVSSTVSNEIGFYFTSTPVGTAGANDYYEVTGVQLEIASSASAFMTNGPTYEAELAACQRYYLRTTGANYTRHGRAQAGSTTNATVQAPLPASLRTVPSIAYANTAYWNGTTFMANTGGISAIGTSGANVYFDLAVASGLTLGQTYEFLNNNNNAGYVEYSAEL
jgi:hypothetical protein